MMMAAVPIMILLIFFAITIGVMIAIGRIVYKDAVAHNMNGWLWTVVAIFIPNFIGVIVYLVVRSNAEKEFNCSKCKAKVQADYNICPQCKSQFGKLCPSCKHAVNNEMAFCPYCGESMENVEVMQTASKVSVKTNIAKPLGITLGIFFGSFLLVFIAMFGVGFMGEMAFDSNVSLMSMESKGVNDYQASFGYKSGTSHINFRLDEEKHTGILGNIALEAGEVNCTITDAQGNVVFEKNFIEGDNLSDYQIPLSVTTNKETYKMVLKFTKAEGKVSFEAAIF